MAVGQIKQKQTPEAIAKLEQAFAIDATVAEACYYADIDSATYYRWIKDNPELCEKFARLREKPVLTARQELIKGFKDNPEICLKYLERKRKQEFSTSTNINAEIHGEVGVILLPTLKDIEDA